MSVIINFSGKENQMKQKCPKNKLLNCCDEENKLILTLINFWSEVVAMVDTLNLGFNLEFLR